MSWLITLWPPSIRQTPRFRAKIKRWNNANIRELAKSDPFTLEQMWIEGRLPNTQLYPTHMLGIAADPIYSKDLEYFTIKYDDKATTSEEILHAFQALGVDFEKIDG